MITGISGSASLIVTNGNTNLPYVSSSNIPTVDPLSNRAHYNGDIKYINGNFQIYNNGSWSIVSGHTSIDLSQDIKNIISWAKNKMDQEQQLEKLAEKYPAVKTAKDHLDMILTLTKDHE